MMVLHGPNLVSQERLANYCALALFTLAWLCVILVGLFVTFDLVAMIAAIMERMMEPKVC